MTGFTYAYVATVAVGMADYLRHNPGDAKFYYVRLDRAKQPNLEDVARAAERNVEIRIEQVDSAQPTP